jgi:hypothetical protein
MPLPPTHRLDHPPIVIFPQDSAWNNAKIEADTRAIDDRVRVDERLAELRGRASLDDEQRAELAALEATEPCPWPSRADHPVARYHSGESRYDKKTIEPWLQPTSRPAMIILRRLSWAEYRAFWHIRSDLDNVPEANAYAIRHGVVRAVDLDGLAWAAERRDDSPPLTDTQLEQLRDRLGDGLIGLLAGAVYLVSRAPTPAEGKPSGSSLGG